MPAKTPKAIVDRMNREIAGILELPDVKDRFKSMGIDIAGGSPETFASFMASEAAKWQKIAKDAGVKVN